MNARERHVNKLKLQKTNAEAAVAREVARGGRSSEDQPEDRSRALPKQPMPGPPPFNVNAAMATATDFALNLSETVHHHVFLRDLISGAETDEGSFHGTSSEAQAIEAAKAMLGSSLRFHVTRFRAVNGNDVIVVTGDPKTARVRPCRKAECEHDETLRRLAEDR